jgi:hypothetical protein
VAKLNAGGSALIYSTYLGGSEDDEGFGIAVDAASNAYVTGRTFSRDFPTRNPLQAAFGGGADGFVAKLNPTGSGLVYSTYLGGNNSDLGRRIAVDAAGNAYVSGQTASTNFPTQNPLQPAYAGGFDAFVAKLNAAGSALIYSTYLGGSSGEAGNGIAVDTAGNAYVMGGTASRNFPTANPLQAAFGGGISDAFVAKLNAAGSALIYSTYLGGRSGDNGFHNAVDSAGNAYVTGPTNSTDFPTANPVQTAFGGRSDAFVAKLNPTGSRLIYSTYLGGRSDDSGNGIAVDAAGNAYVTGNTSSTNFPTANPVQAAFGGGPSDAFVAKLNAAGSALIYSTYLGGSVAENPPPYNDSAIAVDTAGNAYVMGGTASRNFPTANTMQAAFGGGIGDAFIAKIAGTPEIEVTPSSLNFGNVTVGAIADQALTVSNGGDGELIVSSITSTSARFSIVSPTGSFTVTAGGQQMVMVRFSPTSAGPQTGQLQITSNDPDEPTVNIGVNGTGVAVPDIDVTPTSLDFGSVPLNQHVDRILTVRNTGTATLMVNSIMSNNSQFSVVSPAGSFTVAVGGQQSVTVRFGPTTVGAQAGRLTITSNDPDEANVNVQLQGVGVAVPDIDVAPTSLDFGSVTIGQSTDRMLTVRNTGGAPLMVTSITSNNARFSVVSPIGSFNVAANGGQQVVTVRFSPNAIGAQNGTLTINSNDPDESNVPVPVSGQGVAAQVPDIDVTPTSLNFGNVTVGTSADLTLTVRNVGTATLTVNSIMSDNARFTVVSPIGSFNVAPNGQQFVTVRFGPTAPSMHMAMLIITSNDPDEPTVSISVSGTGIGLALPDLVVTNLTVMPVNPRPGEEILVSFTLENQGAGTANESLSTVVLSRDATITTADRFLQNDGSPSLAPGDSRRRNVFVVIPPDTPRGSMFIGVIADRLNLVMESNEENNTLAVPISIGFGVVRSFPSPGVVNVPLESYVQLEFSAPLAPESVTPSTLSLRTEAGPVRGRVAAVSSRAFFFPDSRLPALTPVQIRVIGGMGGVRGRVGGIEVPLDESGFVSSFTTEPEGGRDQSPTDGGAPVRVEFGGTIMDDAGTGAGLKVPRHTLKTDTVVSLNVMRGARLPVTGFVQVSEVVQIESQPDGAVAFGPGFDLTLPLLGNIPQNARLRVFQLVEVENQLVPLETGIEAERVTPPGNIALVSGLEVFGTYILYVSERPTKNLSQKSRRPLQRPIHRAQESPPTDDPLLANPNQGGGSATTLYFPVVGQQSGRDARLSLVNPDVQQDRLVTLTAYNDDGTLHDNRLEVVLRGRQKSLLVSDLFPSLPSGAIVAQSNGPVRGFYEIADNFTAPQMLDGAEANLMPLTAMVFLLIRTRDGAITEIHLFNPNDGTVMVRLAAYASSGRRVQLSQETITLQSHQRTVISSRSGSSLFLSNELEGGFVFVESVGPVGIVGAEVVEEAMGGERNVAVLNGVGLPNGCVPTGFGSCQINPPPAARQHTAYAIHLDDDLRVETEVVAANVSDQDTLIAFSAFDSAGNYQGGHPSPRAFLFLRAHEVRRFTVFDLFGIDLASLDGYVRIDDPDSGVVGAVVNRDAMGRTFLTALPLVPDLTQQGQEETEAFFSRLEIRLSNPVVQTGLFILNPNGNDVRFVLSVIDARGMERAEPQTVIERGTFFRARRSLSDLLSGVSDGYFRINVQADLRPGMGGRLIPYATYRSPGYLSAVPPQ